MSRALPLLAAFTASVTVGTPLAAAFSVPSPPARVARVLAATFRAPAPLRAARCVAYRESSFRRTAVSPTSDYGLFQINYRWHRRSGESRPAFATRMFDLLGNVRYAARLSRGGRDWHAWAPHTRAACGL